MSRPYIPAELRQLVIDDAGHRCGYCQSDEVLTGIPLSIEHLTPIAAGGLTVRENLWLSCRPCNELKGAQTHAEDLERHEVVPLFSPRAHRWGEHFAWGEDGSLIVGLTPTGRATIAALHLNRPLLMSARRRWVLAGWHPPRSGTELDPS